MIIELYFIFLFIGVIIGIIEAFSKKLSFFIWVGAIIYSLINGYKSANLMTRHGISNWHWIPLLIVGVFGAYLGKFIYESTFKN